MVFLWKGREQTAKGAKVSWENICFPKSEGGLGLKDLITWNQACVLQNIWAIIANSGSLWIAWINQYVLRGRSLWQLEATKGASWNWNKLLKLRGLAQQFIDRREGKDYWKIPGNKYKAATVWEVLRPKKEKNVWHRLIWGSFVVPKHAFIAWMAVLNRLPTMDRMIKWGIELECCCSLCKQVEESRDHLFFECPFSKEIWKQILCLCGLRRTVLDWHYEFKWAIQKVKGKSMISMVLRVGWNAFIYHIWRERNNRIFRNKEETKEQIMEHIKSVIRHRLAGLRCVNPDPVNLLLYDSWGLFDSIFVNGQ